jgi:hypothetical protein
MEFEGTADTAAPVEAPEGQPPAPTFVVVHDLPDAVSTGEASIRRLRTADLTRTEPGPREGVRYLVFFESPGGWLARRAHTLAANPSETWFGPWMLSSAAILKHLRRERGTTAIVCIDEWRSALLGSAPDGTMSGATMSAGALSWAWPEIDRVLFAPWADTTLDPLVAQLSEQAAAVRGDVMSMHAELLAASEAPPTPPQVTGAPAKPSAGERAPAASMLRDLLSLRASVEDLRAQHQAANAALAQVSAEAEVTKAALETRLQQLERERDTIRDRTAAATQDAQDLLEQLHRTQEELESLWMKSRADEQTHHRALELASSQAREFESRAALAGERARHLESELQAKASLATRLTQTESELARVREALKARDDETGTLLQQLHRTQVELETLRLRSQEQERAVERSAVLERDIARLMEKLEDSLRANASLRSTAERLTDERRSLESRVQSLDAAASTASRRLADQSAVIGRLQVLQSNANAQLRELEIVASQARLRLAVVEDSAPGHVLRIDDDEAVSRLGRLAFGSIHEEGQHRHLDFSLHGAVPPGGPVPVLRGRLLEHRGRPGLALLRGVDDPAPFANWVAHGREDTDAYCLLIPGDRLTVPIWQHLGSADWGFLLTLVLQVDQGLATHADPSLRAWHTVARQLRMQLWQGPPRLRYDGVEVFGEQTTAGKVSVRVEFRGAVFGWNHLGSITLWWRPGAAYDADPAVTAVACSFKDATGRPAPLWSCWPRDSDGSWAEQASLPVGPGMSSQTCRGLWAALPPLDRQIILALLDAMPAAELVPGTTVPPLTATISSEAGRLHKQARRAMLQLELRRVARGLLRR